MTESAKIDEDVLKRLRYHEELEKVSDLMVKKCSVLVGAGYRIVDNPANESDFIPSPVSFDENDMAVYHYSAPKEEVGKLNDEQKWKYATRLGVSMYTSFDKANKEANRWAKKIKSDAGVEEAEVYKKGHAWIVKVDHDEDTGITSPVHRTTGHYNLFPFDGIKLLELIDESFGYKEVVYEDDNK